MDTSNFYGQGQNATFNSQQLHVDTSSLHGQRQNTSNTNYVSSTLDGNQWTNQFVQPYQMNTVYNNFQLNSTPNKVNQNSNTHPNFNTVRHMGTPEKNNSFTSSPPINQMNNQYSFGNCFRQDNFPASGMFHSECNPSHYYPTMSHNQNNMMSFPNCTTHCNCCSRFGNDVNTNSGVYSPQFIPTNYCNTQQSENSWNTSVSNSMQTPGSINYSSQIGTDQWQGQSNYPSPMIGNHWNDNGSSLMTRQQQLNYGSHMVQNQWNRVGIDQLNSTSNVNSFPLTQNQHTFNQSTNQKYYTNQLHGNRDGFNLSPPENNVRSKNQSTGIALDGFGKQSRDTYMQSNSNGSSTQGATEAVHNISGKFICNSTPAHNQKVKSVTNKEETFAVPLDLSTSTHYSLDMSNDSKNKSKSKNKTKKSATATITPKRTYTLRSTTNKKVTKTSMNKKLNEQSEKDKCQTSGKGKRKTQSETTDTSKPTKINQKVSPNTLPTLDKFYSEKSKENKHVDNDSNQGEQVSTVDTPLSLGIEGERKVTDLNEEKSPEYEGKAMAQKRITSNPNENQDNSSTSCDGQKTNSNTNNCKESESKKTVTGERHKPFNTVKRNENNEQIGNITQDSISKGENAAKVKSDSVHLPQLENSEGQKDFHGQLTTQLDNGTTSKKKTVSNNKSGPEDITETATEGDDDNIHDDYYDRSFDEKAEEKKSSVPSSKGYFFSIKIFL